MMSKQSICIALSGVFGALFTLGLLIALSLSDSSKLPVFQWLNENIETLKTLSPIAIALSAFTALAVYGTTIKRHQEEDAYKRSLSLLEEFKLGLERAYSTLIDPDDSLLPKRDRIAWLTAARMIIRAQSFKNLITEPTVAHIADEHEEYWRHRFFEAFDKNSSNMDCDYYENKSPSGDLNEISLTSAAIILEFIRWKGEDPIDKEEAKDLLIQNANQVHFSYAGLEHFIEKKSPRLFEMMENARKPD
jgi:hypothetical protein